MLLAPARSASGEATQVGRTGVSALENGQSAGLEGVVTRKGAKNPDAVPFGQPKVGVQARDAC